MPVLTEQQRAWASSGAMALTGRPGGDPLLAPDGVVDRIRALAEPLGIDPLPLLTERAAIAGFGRRGEVSCGGSTRLLRASDGWVAVSLARDTDVAAVPAWLELDPGITDDDPWPAVVDAVARMLVTTVVERGILLDLPIAAVPPRADPSAVGSDHAAAGRTTTGDATQPPPDSRRAGAGAGTVVWGRAVADPTAPNTPSPTTDLPSRDARPDEVVPSRAGVLGGTARGGGAHEWEMGHAFGNDPFPGDAGAVPVLAEHVADGDGGIGRRRARPLVVDLSSLWAGPLCARLLGERGARVVKVESVRRPDGARSGPTAFFDLLHQGHEMVALDFGEPGDVERLRGLLAAADVVIEGSRPRALEQLGIDATALVRQGPAVWVSITGHGRQGSDRHRVAFGDDAAAGGGLVAWDAGGPCFVADAVADPLTGVSAAAATVTALAADGHWLLDVAMTRVAAFVANGAAGEPWRPGRDIDAEPPRPPMPPGPAAPLGTHTRSVLAELR